MRLRFIPQERLADQDDIWAAEQGRGASRRALDRRFDRREGIWARDTDRFAMARPDRSGVGWKRLGNDLMDAAFRVFGLCVRAVVLWREY